ncbi:MAG: hypothetical protein SGJ11_06710 [Phycisphaerae bacterium]|nr:hypothetical protein [Phycisphaerae bacterium]
MRPIRNTRHSRNATYLNAILTVNAIMVAALVWTHVSDGPSVANASPLANALLIQVDGADTTGGVPNAGLQRLQTLNEIRALRDDVQRLELLLASGRIRFGVSNFAELKKIIDEGQAQKAPAASSPGTGTAVVAPSSVVPSPTPTAPSSNP